MNTGTVSTTEIQTPQQLCHLELKRQQMKISKLRGVSQTEQVILTMLQKNAGFASRKNTT